MAYLGARKRTTRQSSSQAVNRRRSEGGLRAWFASVDWNNVRFRTVAVLFFVVWGALWIRAGYVQLWEGPFLAERARRQHMAAETVAMPRGMITDRNGHILARSVECCSVYANPSIITDIQATAATLAGILGRPADQIRPLLEKKRSLSGLPAAWTMPRPRPSGRRISRASSCPASLSAFTLPSGGGAVARLCRHGRQGA